MCSLTTWMSRSDLQLFDWLHYLKEMVSVSLLKLIDLFGGESRGGGAGAVEKRLRQDLLYVLCSIGS